MKFTLRQLEVFLATARSENISAAADSIAMSQSAASGALKDLEQRYDTQLFDRIGKRLKLNSQGRALLPQVEAFVSQAQELEDALLQREPAGTLKIGATMTIGNYVAIPIIASFKRDNPQLDVKLHVANTQRIANEVLNFELDIGMIEGEYVHSDLSVELWRVDELVVFCAPSHPYAKQGALTDAQIVAANWVLRERGSGTRQTFDRAMHNLQNDLRIYLELEHTEAIKRAVEAGLGIGCLSRIALEDGFNSGRFVELSAPQRKFHRNFYLIHHAKKYQSQSLLRWIRYCHQFAANANSGS